MVDAESKTKSKRIRHCYPRQEVYHRFIHDNEYYYSNKAHAISSKGNYLSLGDIGRYKSISDIEEYWYPYNRVFAVIDRENKKILVSHKYENLTYELIRAIPDDYTVFHCDNDIPVYNILHDENIDALAKLHLQHCVEQYVDRYLFTFYACLEGKKVLHADIDSLIKKDNNKYSLYYDYEAIKQFIRKYKVKHRTWYNKSLNTRFKLNIYYPNSWNRITIELPTVKQVLTNTIFSKHQVDLFRKRYFYTKYCYGRGIPFKDVKLYWNKEVSSKEMYDYFNKHNIYWLDDYRTESCITWNDYVIRSHEIEEKHRSKYIEENIAKSNQNRKEAIEKANAITNQEDVILAWRNGSRIRDYKIDYREFVLPRRRGQCGTWRTSYIYAGNVSFKNTQLKLIGENVVTSRHATVPLSSAIAAFHLFDSCRSTYDATGKDRFIFPNRFNVGLYNLRDIQYVEKFADNGEKLGYKSWLIRIGCHNLWIDDIMNFIRYYHLEDQFLNRPEDNNKKKDNSKLK